MGTGSGSRSDSAPMAEINVTPLIDVMLVVLIIFMISIPVLTQKVQLDLPQKGPDTRPQTLDLISVRIENDGRLLWNDEAMSAAQMGYYMARAGQQTPQPELRLSIGDQARYETVAAVITQAKNADIGRIGFDSSR